LSWNATGTYIATGAHDKTLRVWNPEKTNFRHSTELKGLSGAVERVQFHPFNENELASCTQDGSVRLWDVRTKASVGEIKVGVGSKPEPFTLAWKPDGSELVVGLKVGLRAKSSLQYVRLTENRTIPSFQSTARR
jgi:THO complex subunit 3